MVVLNTQFFNKNFTCFGTKAICKVTSLRKRFCQHIPATTESPEPSMNDFSKKNNKTTKKVVQSSREAEAPAMDYFDPNPIEQMVRLEDVQRGVKRKPTRLGGRRVSVWDTGSDSTKDKDFVRTNSEITNGNTISELQSVVHVEASPPYSSTRVSNPIGNSWFYAAIALVGIGIGVVARWIEKKRENKNK